ncbi:T9SS type A sorting domain-containing protein [Bacteroidota bacterium]
MKKTTLFLIALIFPVLCFSQSAIIIDHNSIDLTDIPDRWIDSAKANLFIGYGHTSHGSQLASGMNALESYYSNGKYDWSHSGGAGELHLFEGDGYGEGYLDHDCGYTGWDDETREYLDGFPDCNVIIWSWCGQVNDVNLETHYFEPMEDLESDYPYVKFVYMTGHLEGLGPDGSLYQANQQIRDYCNQNNKILFDFADMEKYTPDLDTNFQNYNANDACNYNHPEGGERNWANNWLGNYPSHLLTQISQYCSSCAHSVSLNCTKKGIACWFLWARLAGWIPGGQPATIETETVSGSPFCAGVVVDIPFTIEGTFNSGNKFIAQLSDENRSFSIPVVLDSLIGTSSDTLKNVELPGTLSGGTGYRIRIVSTDPVVTGSDNGDDLVINSLPEPYITGSNSVCEADLENYSCSFTMGYEYKWTATNGVIEGSSTDTLCYVKWSNYRSGNIELVETVTATGCKDSTYLQVQIHPLPVPIITGSEEVCANSIETYYTPGVSGIEHSWSVAGGTLLSSPLFSTVEVLWGEGTSGTLTLEQTNTETGCTNKDTSLITINPLPEPEILGENEVCENKRYLYTSEYEDGHLYQWLASGGDVLGFDNDTLAIVEWGNAGVGALMLIETIQSTACLDTAILEVSINPLPLTQITGNDIVVRDSAEFYYAVGALDIQNEWQVSGGSITGSSTRDSVNVRWNEDEMGEIKLVRTNTITGCRDSSVKEIIITDIKIPFITGDTASCENDEKRYFTTDNSLIHKQWYVEGGTKIAGTEQNLIDVVWGESGTGTVKVILSVEDKNFTDSIVKQVQINPIPKVYFTSENNEICIDEEEFELTGGFPEGGTYSGNHVSNNIFIPANAGVGEHSITYTYKEMGCSNFAVDTIRIYPLPEKPVIVPTPLLDVSGLMIENYNGNYHYQWYVDDVLIDQYSDESQIFYILNGNYKVVVIDEHGCENSSETVLVDVEDNANNKYQLSIIPNPISGKATINYILNESALVDLSIINLMGVEVLKLVDMKYLNAGHQSIELDASKIPAGVYFCTFRAGGYTETVKMVVVR